MFFEIDISSPVPVYQQIISQVKYAIARGTLTSGDRLPTVRECAAAIRVNRNTVSRAYNELEREGIIVGRAGQGSFVSDSAPALRANEARAVLTAAFDETLAKAYHFRMERDEVESVFKQRLSKVKFPETKPKERS
jgi:GntR family transcriptional regulator